MTTIEKSKIIEEIARGLVLDISVDGTIIIKIPESCFNSINNALPDDYKVSPEPLSEELKKVSCPSVVHNFSNIGMAIQTDNEGRHAELYLPRANFLHLWLDRLNEIGNEEYKICESLFHVYLKMTEPTISDIHTYVWDNDVLSGNIPAVIEASISNNGNIETNLSEITEWDDIFVHYGTCEDDNWTVSWKMACESFNEWKLKKMTEISFGGKLGSLSKAELVNAFISDVASTNFGLLRKRGVSLPKGTLNYREKDVSKTTVSTYSNSLYEHDIQ
jgi:hypothetical protein